MPRSGGIASVCSASLWVSVWFILDSRPQYTNSWCSDMGIRSHSLHGQLSLFTTVLDTSPQTCLAYLVVIGPTYELYRTWGRRRRFWLLMGGYNSHRPPACLGSRLLAVVPALGARRSTNCRIRIFRCREWTRWGTSSQHSWIRRRLVRAAVCGLCGSGAGW